MLMRFIYFALILSLDIIYSLQAFAGPFELDIRKVQNCPDRGLNKFYVENVRIKKLGPDLFWYTGNVTTLIPTGDNLSGKIQVTKVKDDGNRLENMYEDEFDKACVWLLTYLPTLTNDMFESTNRKSCPFDPGVYQINSTMNLKFSEAMPSSIPYGKLIFTFSLYADNEMVGCFLYNVDILPRRGAKRKKKRN